MESQETNIRRGRRVQPANNEPSDGAPNIQIIHFGTLSSRSAGRPAIPQRFHCSAVILRFSFLCLGCAVIETRWMGLGV